MKKKEKVVVFGGSGFVGSHVADTLSERGYDVFLFDHEASSYLRPDQTMITADILDQKKVAEAVNGARYIYNFSGIADLDTCSDNAVATIRTNVVGHTIILEEARRHKINRVVLASSVYVYSKHGSFYTVSKQSCEQITEEFQRKYGLEYTILRFGSLYGPRAQMWNGMYRYLYQAIAEGKIEYPGTGEERRKYIHVRDAAQLSVDILTDQFKNQSIIITGGSDISSHDLMKMISEMLDKKVQVTFQNKESYFHYTITPYSFVPRMGVQLSPNPSIDLGEGMLQQIEEIYYKVKKK